MLENGYIKLHRKLTKWRWYHDANTIRVFLHLLLTANYERGSFEDRTVERGQRITSVSKLSQELKISVRSIRTALNHLKSTNELTIETTSKYTIITVNNYNEYQQVTNELTNDRQTSDKRLTNDRQQRKKDKESNKKKNARREGALNAHGTFLNVYLSDFELADLRERYPEHYETKIERLSRYLESTGKTYRNHYSTLLEWLEEDTALEQPKKSSYDISTMDEIDTLDFIELD